MNSEFSTANSNLCNQEEEVTGIMNFKTETRGCETYSINMGATTTCSHLAKNIKPKPY